MAGPEFDNWRYDSLSDRLWTRKFTLLSMVRFQSWKSTGCDLGNWDLKDQDIPNVYQSNRDRRDILQVH